MRWTIHGRRAVATMVIVAVAFLAALWLWNYYRIDPWTRDGRLRADVAKVAPDVSGLVTEVDVSDNMPVRRGQVLFVIDRARFEIALQQADAALEQSQAGEELAQSNIAEAQAKVQAASATLRAQSILLAEAQREDIRNRKLGTLVSTESVQQGATKVAQLDATVAQARASLIETTAGISQAKASLSQAKATVAQSTAARNTARLNLQRASVVAPVNGIAADVQLRPGDYLTAGHPAFGVLDAASLHVDGYFEETKLRSIHIGDQATIQLMGEGRELRGHVESIAPGIADRDRTGSGDLLANVNPTFNWVRLAQRVPVRIHIDQAPSELLLIAGRTATVTLESGSADHASLQIKRDHQGQEKLQ